MPSTVRAASDVSFVCNLCGTPNVAPASALTREAASCDGCSSNVRFRSIAHLVATELYADDRPLASLPRRRDLRGLGLSDAPAYARVLKRKLDYRNTFYHRRPRFDITAVSDADLGRYDLVIASEVFEHVAPPVSRAFVNARRLLNERGLLILTVPFTLEAETQEHYPDLHHFHIDEGRGRWRLHNRTIDGREQVFDDPVFHGGPGATLEMRLFSRAALERHFHAAGFARVRFAHESFLPFGISWPHPWSVPIVAYAS